MGNRFDESKLGVTHNGRLDTDLNVLSAIRFCYEAYQGKIISCILRLFLIQMLSIHFLIKLNISMCVGEIKSTSNADIRSRRVVWGGAGVRED